MKERKQEMKEIQGKKILKEQQRTKITDKEEKMNKKKY